MNPPDAFNVRGSDRTAASAKQRVHQGAGRVGDLTQEAPRKPNTRPNLFAHRGMKKPIAGNHPIDRARYDPDGRLTVTQVREQTGLRRRTTHPDSAPRRRLRRIGRGTTGRASTSHGDDAMKPPSPRGPVSAAVRDGLLSSSGEPFMGIQLPDDLNDILRNDDLQLALWMLYEQSYRAFEGAHDHEWDPAAVAMRRRLERPFEEQVRTATAAGVEGSLAISNNDIVAQIEHLIARAPGPDVARFLHRDATRQQVLDYLAQRSVYHLKESDPHSFVVGRVGGPAKVALAELQYDEFGAGRPERLHQHLYAVALEAAGLDPAYGAYVEQVPASTLAVNNLMSLLALSYRLRGAALGHLAAFESTSSVPCRRIAAGIERVGLPDATAAYFHEHVEADAAHEQIVLREICGNFVEREPTQRSEVLFGVAACLYVDGVAADDLLGEWTRSGAPELAS